MKAIGHMRHVALLTVLSLLLVPASALAGAEAEPFEGEISIVLGQPIRLPPLSTTGEVDHVMVEVDGKRVFTDEFPSRSAEEVFETRHSFDRLGIELEVPHTLVETAFDWEEKELASATYTLTVHPLPLIPKVHVAPLVVVGQTHLVGFQLRGVMPGSQVMAWGRGFIGRPGTFRIPLQLHKALEASRTYVVRGGLSWFNNIQPHVVFSIAPPRHATKFGFTLRGRVFTGYLRTKDDRATVIRQTDGWKRCAYEIAEETRGPSRPPRRASCEYLF
jgi:hypothetical protein